MKKSGAIIKIAKQIEDQEFDLIVNFEEELEQAIINSVNWEHLLGQQFDIDTQMDMTYLIIRQIMRVRFKLK